MKMLRRLPKILRFIPGTAQDVRAYFLTLQYWLAGSARTTSAAWSTSWSTAMPTARARAARLWPSRSRWNTRNSASTTRACRNGMSADAGRPAPRGHQRPARHGRPAAHALVPAGRQRGHYDGVITALEARGLRVIPAFATGLDSRPAIERFFFDGRPHAHRRRGVADRLLAGRRPGLQRREGRRGDAGPLDVPYLGRDAGGVPDAWTSGAAPTAACCRWKRR
jgi:magnesium chelatase subunit H